MLITKKVKVKATNKLFKHLKNLGYNCEYREEMEVLVEHLTKGSSVIVEVKCEGGCDGHFMIPYHSYLEAVEENKYFHDFCCLPCFNKVNNSPENNPMNKKEAVEKVMVRRKKTYMDKYGVEHNSQVEEVKQKKKKTFLKKYGVENQMQIPEVLEKKKKTCIEKYGAESPMQNEEVIQKRLDTLIENFGTTGIQSIPEIKEKTKNTMMERYGTENVNNIPGMAERIRKIKETNGTIVPRELLSAWDIYQIDCDYYTRKIKKTLYENWDGFDYYDDEYIKENLNLHYNHNNYPSIDHKTSVQFGFLNNISSEEICRIDNLCITKRQLNSKKHEKSDKEFKEWLKNLEKQQPQIPPQNCS